MRCRHRTYGQDLFIQYTATGPYEPQADDPRTPIAWRCVKCDEYASLGPSNDTGVEHEIAAAAEDWDALLALQHEGPPHSCLACDAIRLLGTIKNHDTTHSHAEGEE
jgi:hypothetical protein